MRQVWHLSIWISLNLSKIPPLRFTPLKIRGVRGVMRNAINAEQASSNMMPMEITPFIPLTLRERFKERILILRVPLLR